MRRIALGVAFVLAFTVGGVSAGSAAPTAGPAPATTAATARTAHSVTFDGYSLMIDGQREPIWSGEFHYFRLPSPDLWRDVLQKMKAGGFNAVSLYFEWAYHSPAPGVYDFSGVRDVDRLLDIAAEVGIWVIARPGPYINAEADSGGFPGWLATQQGRARSAAPDYLAAADEWLSRIDPIIARHQLTDGTGTVILYQVENEYGSNTEPAYMQHLEAKARADGITVPLTHNYCCGGSRWATGPGAVDMPGQDSYPQGFNCSNPARWSGVGTLPRFRADAPIFSPEFQGGSFDPWGGPGYDACRQLTGPDFESVFYKSNLGTGATLQSFYMLYGGTSWGWIPDPSQVYTSYDYGAAITESRQLTAKYDEDKRLGYFVQAVTPLTKTDAVAATPPTNPAVLQLTRANPDDGTRLYVLRHADGTSTNRDGTHIAVDLGAAGSYPSVPQQPGTEIVLNGRDAKALVAGYHLGGQYLAYSTSEIMTHAAIGGRDVALLYGRAGEAGETVLRYAAQPMVTVLAGTVTATWTPTGPAGGDLRLNYTHDGLARVLVTGGGRPPLLLLLATDQVAATFWRQDTPGGPVLVRGPYLVRTAALGSGGSGGTLALTGDTAAAGDVEVFAAGATQVTWNGMPVPIRGTAGGTLTGRLNGPRPVTLPALTQWRHQFGTPEAQPPFDDSSWTVADHLTTANPTPPGTLPVLYADDYGIHHGDVWYRGHFTGQAGQTGVDLAATTGRAGAWAAWLNGVHLGATRPTGSGTGSRARLAFPAGALRPGADNVLAVLVENMGHNEDFNANDTHKEPRGLTAATLVGAPLSSITWRLTGAGETLADPARGPLNSGGLYGERAGWFLPGLPDGGWPTVSLPHAEPSPGVAWYRTGFTLDLPPGQDDPVGIRVADDPARHYRALVYVNGWLIGRYVNDLGPQHVFPVPAGILRTNGANTVAIAAWGMDGTGGLGQVSLTSLGAYSGGVAVADVASPGYDPARYAVPQAVARLALSTPDGAEPGRTYRVSATFTALDAAGQVALSLAAPAGWVVTPVSVPGPADVAPGGTLTASWQAVAPAGALPAFSFLTATARCAAAGAARTLTDTRAVRALPTPPSGTAWVSDLPFLAQSNGWGPVERDTSNGENAAGDGVPMALRGTPFGKGLGVHASGEVDVYLGGRCSRLTATVGADDEVVPQVRQRGRGGTVSFAVLADGTPVYASGTLSSTSAPAPVSVDLTGLQVVGLVIGDGGDGNELDHGDWAGAQLACG